LPFVVGNKISHVSKKKNLCNRRQVPIVSIEVMMFILPLISICCSFVLIDFSKKKQLQVQANFVFFPHFNAD
jgi:hypothetical protein